MWLRLDSILKEEKVDSPAPGFSGELATGPPIRVESER
jgi:hypothetical protein